MWIGEDGVAKGVVKIKNLNTTEEEFVERKSLIPRVQELLAANPVLLSQEQQAELKKKE